MRATPGGVTVLAINASRHIAYTDASNGLRTLPLRREAPADKTVQLNGRTLTLGAKDELPTSLLV